MSTSEVTRARGDGDPRASSSAREPERTALPGNRRTLRQRLRRD